MLSAQAFTLLPSNSPDEVAINPVITPSIATMMITSSKEYPLLFNIFPAFN